jgi:hypothetical protein
MTVIYLVHQAPIDRKVVMTQMALGHDTFTYFKSFHLATITVCYPWFHTEEAHFFPQKLLCRRSQLLDYFTNLICFQPFNGSLVSIFLIASTMCQYLFRSTTKVLTHVGFVRVTLNCNKVSHPLLPSATNCSLALVGSSRQITHSLISNDAMLIGNTDALRLKQLIKVIK